MEQGALGVLPPSPADLMIASVPCQVLVIYIAGTES